MRAREGAIIVERIGGRWLWRCTSSVCPTGFGDYGYVVTHPEAIIEAWQHIKLCGRTPLPHDREHP
jgi:hypothetical protein